MDDSLSSGGDDDNIIRTSLTAAKRLALVERDVRSHARSLTHIIESMGAGFTETQMTQLHRVVHEELADMGLRLDDADHIDQAKEDFRFLRRLRTSWDGASRKVGNSVLTALLLVFASVIALGFWAWLRRGTGQ